MSEADADADAGGGREEIWLEKYRPERLADVKGQEAIVERLQSYVDRDDLSHMLFAGPAGTGKCATGETPVLTDDGLARMADVVGDTEGFAESDDLEVLTYTEEGAFEYTEPSHVFGRQAEELVEVTTRDGGRMSVTPEHRLLVVTEEGLSWRPAESLEDGDRVVRPLRTPLPEPETGLSWVEAMDGERTFVHVTDSFACEHGIPFEENLVGTKKRVVRRLRRGESVDEITAALDTPRKTVQAAKREFADVDLGAVSTVCPLSVLRGFDTDRERLREHVEGIQYVNPVNNARSDIVTPPWELTPEVARFVGLAISEARIDGGRLKFYNTDEALLEAFESVLREVFGVEPRTGEQHGVPYVAVDNRTLTHYLESCFDVFDRAMGGDGIGSTLLRADEASRRAFLRAVFDAEAHVQSSGTIELTQKVPEYITLVSYLLAGFGVPSRRAREHKHAANGDGTDREYHTLYVSSADHLRRFEQAVGFSVTEKATRLAEHTDRTSNPNSDTVPTQTAVDALCEQLHIPKRAHVPDSLNPDSPGRERYLDAVAGLLDTATAKLEAVQEARETLARMESTIEAVAAVPAQWAGATAEMKPLETRTELADEVGVATGRLLEYARGERTPYAGRVQAVLESLSGDEQPSVAAVQSVLSEVFESLEIPYERVADGTPLRGHEVSNLLDGDDHDIRSMPRFGTVADRLDEELSRMASAETLDHLRTLDRLVRSDLYFDEVETVERVTESRRVYDLTVPGTRNYVAGNVPTVMHNTTSSIAIAKELYGEDWSEHFLELNASDERGIDVVRDRIKSFARTSFGGANYRIIFLDEADALCVPPGTEVVAGYPSSPEIKPIEEVAESGEPMPSVDFETNEIQSDEGRLVDSGVADFFEVELEDGRTVRASLSHPFFVVDEDGRLVERELQELSPGDEIADFKDEVGVSRCEVCGDWAAGRFCSVDCKNAGHSREMQGEHYEREEFEPGLVSDGGPRQVETVEVSGIEYSHRGKAYNISMAGTPNFMLANGVLTHNTSDAQSALRRTMEQFSNNVRFILSCNYSSQIIDPIQSRCAVFRFAPLSDEAVAEQVREVAAAEGIEVTEDGVEALVYAADGDMRRAINGLQAAAVSTEAVDEAAVFAITSTARPEDIREMVTLALDGEFSAARARLDELLTEEGIAGGDIIDQLHRSVWEFEMSDEAAVRLLDRIGEADYRITEGANERIQLEALLASLALE